jgi:hypothetical protein
MVNLYLAARFNRPFLTHMLSPFHFTITVFHHILLLRHIWGGLGVIVYPIICLDVITRRYRDFLKAAI